MTELILDQIWNSNTVEATQYFEDAGYKDESKYKRNKLHVVMQYRSMFYKELMGRVVFYTAAFLLVLSGKVLTEVPIVAGILIITLISFYDYIFYYRYFQKLTTEIISTQSLSIKNGIEATRTSFKKYRELNVRFVFMVVILGSLLSIGYEIFIYTTMKEFIIELISTVIASIFCYAGSEGYYDYIYKPYEEQLTMMLLQMESE